MNRPRKLKTASLTVEASLVFPIFLFALMALCSIFRYINTEYALEKSMLAVARNLGQYPEIVSAAAEKRTGFAESMIGSLAGKKIPISDLSVSEMAERASDAAVIGGLLKKEIEKYPFACGGIEGGSSGLNCIGSILYSEEETIVIKCSYNLRSPAVMFGIGSVPVSQEMEYRYFTGLAVESLLTEQTDEDSDEQEDDTIVYITDEKIVYHLSLECPSLKLVISSCDLEDVPNKRNKGGGKYYRCERCGKGKAPETVYISKDGDRYHYRYDCSGLKRTITEIKLSEAKKTRRACKRCGKGNTKETLIKSSFP